MQELIGGGPTQDQRGRFRRVDTWRHACHAVGAERAIVGVRTDDRHIGHAFANLKAAYAIADLIDFSDDVVAHDERRPAAHPRIKSTTDCHVRVLYARGEHPDPHLASARRRQWSIDHVQPVGIAEPLDEDNSIARFSHPALLHVPALSAQRARTRPGRARGVVNSRGKINSLPAGTLIQIKKAPSSGPFVSVESNRRCGPHTRTVTSVTANGRHFVASMPAPVASGWSVGRVGLAPIGKRRLFTAHAESDRGSNARTGGIAGAQGSPGKVFVCPNQASIAAPAGRSQASNTEAQAKAVYVRQRPKWAQRHSRAPNPG
jgi:hypothetical protein